MTSGGSRRRKCPASAKKPTRSPTGAVCRSCATMPVSIRAPPTRRERRFAFPGSQVFGTGTLPVGVQGRSAICASHFRDAIYFNRAETETLFRVCSANFNLTLFQFFSTNLRENSAGSSALINRK